MEAPGNVDKILQFFGKRSFSPSLWLRGCGVQRQREFHGTPPLSMWRTFLDSHIDVTIKHQNVGRALETRSSFCTLLARER
jgi:hypothetical protein